MKYSIILFSILSIALLCNAQRAAGVNQTGSVASANSSPKHRLRRPIDAQFRGHNEGPWLRVHQVEGGAYHVVGHNVAGKGSIPSPVDPADSSPKHRLRRPMDAQFRVHNQAPWLRQDYTGSEKVHKAQGAVYHVVGHNVGGKGSIQSYGELSKLRHPPQHTEDLSLLAAKLLTKDDDLSLVTVESKTDTELILRDKLQSISKPLLTEPRQPGQAEMSSAQLGKVEDKPVGVIGSTIAGKSSIKSFGNLVRSRVSGVPPQN